ncbi:MAG: hypothetical protein M5R36_24485 [Deltaproteobacteria bacterium]|nr:hypothetical protein [Deltaproteobacteria bacterium]
MWAFWKAPLVLLSFVPVVLAFLSHPLRLPELDAVIEADVLRRVPHRILENCSPGYQITPAPDGETVFINCVRKLARFEKRDGRWTETASYDPHGEWDEAAFDFEAHRAYLYIGGDRRMETIDLDTMTAVRSMELDENVFRPRHTGIYQAIDEDSNRLFLGENNGLVAALRTDDLSKIAGRLAVPEDDTVWRVLFAESRNELYVLAEHALLVLDGDDLSVRRRADFTDAAVDMLLDESSGSVFVSFPAAMRVHRYDAATFENLERFPAPAAVRALAVDHARQWLVMASYNGVVSVREVRTRRLIKRFRVPPIVRRIALFPENGTMIVTSGKNPALEVNYADFDPPFDLTDLMLRWSERAFRFFSLSHGSDGHQRGLEGRGP